MMKTRSQVNLEDDDINDISINSNVSQESASLSHDIDNDIDDNWGNPTRHNYVTSEEFQRLHNDFIDFKKYMADVLNLISKSKRQSDYINDDGPSKSDPCQNRVNNCDIRALQNEIKDLKEQSKKYVNVIEILSENLRAAQEERKTLANERNLLHSKNRPETPTTWFHKENSNNQNITDNNKNDRRNMKVPSTQRIVPGNATYADAAKKGRNITILGDSITGDIKRNEFNKWVKGKCYIKTYSGADSKEMISHVQPTIDRENTDIAIIIQGRIV